MDWIVPVCVVVAMALVLLRAALGPGLFDRVLALNVFGTLTVVLLAFLAVHTDRYYLADIAILYALINFMLTLAILRFFGEKKLREPQSNSRLSDLFYIFSPDGKTRKTHEENSS